MAYLTLPELPLQSRVKERFIDFSADLASQTGGPTQRLLRLGARFAVDVSMPEMEEAQARAWLAVRMQSRVSGANVRLGLPQATGRPTGVTGTGAANALTVTAAGSAAVEPGMLFSVVAGGRSWLHMVTGKDGGLLSIAPRLRTSFTGAALEFQEPAIEGLLDDVEWDLDEMQLVGQSFTITEER